MAADPWGVLDPLAGAQAGLIALARAQEDLRRGVPVALVGAKGASLVVAVETLGADGLEAMRQLDPQARLILTHARAQTLRIRLYTPEVVAIADADKLGLDDLRALADPLRDLATPLKGPFNAERRAGVPEAWTAAVKLAKLARLLPAVMIAAVPSGTNVPSGIAHLAIDHVTHAEVDTAANLAAIVTAKVPLDLQADTKLVMFRGADGGGEHLAIVLGAPKLNQPVLARLHSECFTGDLLGSLKCDCGEQLRGALAAMAKAGGGVLLYLAQEGRGLGLLNKLRAYRLQDDGFDTIEANERLGFDADERDFRAAARMLEILGYRKVRLMTNNPDKVQALTRHGIEVVERVPHAFAANPHNQHYLDVKRLKSGHWL